MSSPAEILPNVEIIYTSAACDKYHVWSEVYYSPCVANNPSTQENQISKWFILVIFAIGKHQ